MKRGQLLLALLAALAVGAVAWLAGGSGGGTRRPQAAAATRPRRRRTRSSSRSPTRPRRRSCSTPLIKEFNAKGETAKGRPVVVKGQNVASGEAESRIASGSLKPVAWSPASSLWGRLVNFEADRALAPEENPSLVRTPLVIAMWEPMARALGWPRKPLGFADVLKLADAPRGWAGQGHPEFGAFKLVHTNPDFSTAGLSAVVAEYYAATGKKEGLRRERGHRARRRARRSGHRALDRPLRRHDAVHRRPDAQGRARVRERGRHGGGRRCSTSTATAGRSPPRGDLSAARARSTPTARSSCSNAPWVRPEQAEGAKAFQRFLAEKLTPELRPATASAPPTSTPSRSRRSTPPTASTRPSPSACSACRSRACSPRSRSRGARTASPPTSCSCSTPRARCSRRTGSTAPRSGLRAFFAEVGAQDRLGLTTFSDEIRPLQPVGPFGQGAPRGDRPRPRGRGRHRVLRRDAARVRQRARARRPRPHQRRRPAHRRRGHRLGRHGRGRRPARSQRQGDTENKVRVFTIAYSAGASRRARAAREDRRGVGRPELRGPHV